MSLRTNEVVIKIVIKDRSPSMRHVSRIPQGCLWIGCLKRMNFDPKIQIGKYRPQTPTSRTYLPKENSRRDEWINLLHLFNISHFSSLCCAQEFQLYSCSTTMTKRDARTNRRRQDYGKIKSRRTLHLISICLDKFLIP